MKNIPHILFLPLLVFFSSFSFSQTIFQKVFGDYNSYALSGNKIRQTTDGGYVILGSKDYFNGDVDFYVMKTNSNGDTLWTKTYGGSGYDLPSAMEQTSDGGYILSGSYNNYYESYLIKLNSNGSINWSTHYNFGGYSGFDCVKQTSDGGYIASGAYRDTNNFSTNDILLVKTNSAGNIQWKKNLISLFPSYMDIKIQQTSDGGFAVFGYQYSNGNNFFLFKTDLNGNVSWSKNFYISNSGITASAFRQTSDGGYIMCGIPSGLPNTPQNISQILMMIKTNSLGDTLWTKQYYGNSEININDLDQTIDGGFILSGSKPHTPNAGYDAFLMKTDSVGLFQWGRIFGFPGGKSNWANSVRQTNDSGYCLTGSAFVHLDSTSGNVYSQLYFIKTDSWGNADPCLLGYVSVQSYSTNIPLSSPVYSVSTPIVSSSALTTTKSGASPSYSACSLLSTENYKLKDGELTIFPNPSSGIFQINISSKVPITKSELTIYNMMGEIVLTSGINSENTSLDISSQPSGIYFVKIISENKIYSAKIIKE